MKKLYFLLMVLSLFTAATAQIVNIPDANFKTKLLAASPNNNIAKNLSGVYFKVDANSNGEIEVSEALLVSYLDVSWSNISDMSGIQSFSNLTSLSCEGNQQTNLNLSGLAQLIYLSCAHNQLTFLDLSGLAQLREMYCYSNQLTILDLSGLTQLRTLACSNNQLTNLNLSGLTQLRYLHCYGNKLINLDLLDLTHLITLECYNNQLANLNLSGLTQLNYLRCYSNQITNLNLTGLTELRELNCYDNILTNLDLTAFTNLTALGCSLNQLTNLDLSGLAQLSEMYCYSNQLTDLDLSGLTELRELNCYDNILTNLDLSGLTQLRYLYCHDNKLTNLDLSGLTLVSRLYCNSNPNLETLFMKDVIEYDVLSIGQCPNLKYICANEKLISKVQLEIDKNNYTNCHVNSYCSFTPGGTFYTVQGTTTLDNDINGCDENDIVYPNLKFSITDGTTNGSIISNVTGNYSIPVQAGTHTITPIIENPTYFTVSPANFKVSFPTTASPYTQNFCITPNGIHNDLEVTVIPLQAAVPGFDTKYKMVYKNKGSSVQSGSVSLNFDDAILDFVSANPMVTSQTSDNLAWDFTDLQPFETREIVFTLNVNSPMETPAVNGGDVLHYTAIISSTDTDETPADNAFSLNQTVVGPFDPNDKTCLEGSVITPALIGQYVHYMIRFENKGTYPAQNIVVKDMIDLSKFDISTLVPTSASHSYVTRITNGNKVEFIFENINLPFDDANNDGYVTFKIKTLPTLVVGDTFENEANIYFDYNFPILTNKATSTFQALGVPDFEFSNYLSLYPNPVNDVLKLSTKSTIEVNSISVYNALGQMVIAIPNAETVSSVDVANLTSGTYFVKVNTNRGTSNAKFIKN